MSSLSVLVGKRIREIRESKNIKQVELANMIDVEATNLSKLEKGAHLPKEENIRKITKALGIEVKDLFDFGHLQSREKLLNVIHKNAKTERVFFFDAALLFEMKWNIYCQAVILADVDKNIQKQRVMKRDNISVEDFEKIVSLQMDNEHKKMFTDVIINTNKPENLLKSELIKVIKELTNA